jgi:RND family efflux transporter MFP subunit
MHSLRAKPSRTTVIPAKAGIQSPRPWVPAFAGTTDFFVALLLLAAIGCSREALPPETWVPVRVQQVAPAGEAAGVRYTANVNPWSQVDVAFKANGYVASIRQVKSADGRMRDLQAGDAIARGTELARLQDADYADKLKKAKADLARAVASLQKSQEDWRRAQALFATASITEPDYDKARWEYESAQASVDGSRAQVAEATTNLGYTVIAAPMDAVVVSRKVEVGSLVSAATVAFVVADSRLAKVVFGIPDVMLRHVTLGAPLDITTESFPGRKFAGKVTSVAPAADAQTRVFQVEVTVPNASNELKDGMIAALDIQGAPQPTTDTAIPLGAIVRGKTPESYAVYVVADEGGKLLARLREVQLGQVFGNHVAIVSGVGPKDPVIVSGNTVVKDGDVVRIVH